MVYDVRFSETKPDAHGHIRHEAKVRLCRKRQQRKLASLQPRGKPNHS